MYQEELYKGGYMKAYRRKKIKQICKAMYIIALHIILGTLLVYTFGMLGFGMLGVGI